MNAELLAMLGGSMPGASSRRENEPKTILSFKAGKMIAERQPVSIFEQSPLFLCSHSTLNQETHGYFIVFFLTVL